MLRRVDHPNMKPMPNVFPMNIVVLDGFTLNPGDNPWTDVAALGDLTVHERTTPCIFILFLTRPRKTRMKKIF